MGRWRLDECLVEKKKEKRSINEKVFILLPVAQFTEKNKEYTMPDSLNI